MNKECIIYENINEYYNISEDILKEVNNKNDTVLYFKKEEILNNISNDLKQKADNLTATYILLLKNKKNIKIKQYILNQLDKLMVDIENYKNIVYNLYNSN